MNATSESLDELNLLIAEIERCSVSSDDTCKHDRITNNICTLCGEEQTNIPSCSTPNTVYILQHSTDKTKNIIASLKDDIKNLNIDDDLQFQIFEMYTKITHGNIHRSNMRKGILCACIITVFKQNDKVIDETELLAFFNIRKNKLYKGIRHVKLELPESRILHNDCKWHVRLLCNTLKIDPKHFDDIYALYLKSKALDAEGQYEHGALFQNRNPKLIASILIYKWHIATAKEVMPISQYIKQCKISKYMFTNVIKMVQGPYAN